MSENGLPGRSGEFFTLLEELRVFRAGPLAGDPADRALARATGTSPTTIGDWLRGERFPQTIDKVLAVVRIVRDAADRRGVIMMGSGSAGLLDEDRWRAAYQQEAQQRAGVISGGVKHAQAFWALAGRRVRVSENDLRLLGVHAAIRVPGIPDEVPPEYVPRDTDFAEFGVRAKVEAAAQRGGFVLLVGGSSVGKTRCAAEAVRTLLPDWWLMHPAGPPEVNALAQAPPPRTVVWLDELQRYLDGEHGLTGAVVRALLTASHPVVIIGTLWPDRYAAYTAVPAPGAYDSHARERQMLDLADVVRIAPAFSPAEQDRARTAAARDRRLALALGTEGYGLTQTLAAAPQLVARWEDAQAADPYAWAVLTAALDAARLGVRAPLSADLLRAAAPGYCTSAQQAEAPANWFEQALAYATQKLRGAAAALSPAGTGMGQVAGYTVADYLLQRAAWERRTARVPASTWDALISHIRDPADAFWLAYSAKDRLLYRYAIPLYRHAADAGDEHAVMELVHLLAERGDLDGVAQILRARADAGDWAAADKLADLLDARGDLDGVVQILRALADADDWAAADEWVASRLADLLAQRGDLDEAVQILRARADADDWAAARLVDLLDARGDLDELRARADAGDDHAADRLAGLLSWRGDLDELRARANAGDRAAAAWLAARLAGRGDLDEAVQILRPLADAGEPAAGMLGAAGMGAADQLAYLLAEHGDLDELRARANAGDRAAAYKLVDLLAERGDLDEAIQILRARADADDWAAPAQLAHLLEKRGDLDGAIQILRPLADAGEMFAASRLAELLEKRGDLDGAIQILRARAARDQPAAAELARLLVVRGDLDELRARANAGDKFAAPRLAYLLAEQGDLDKLRARANASDWAAANRLAELLAQQGDLDGAVQIHRARANVGAGSAWELGKLLTQHGRGEEAERLRRFGLNLDGSIARE